MRVLVTNGGSSSFKCALHDLAGDPLPVSPPQPAWEARVEWDRRAQVAEVLGPVLASVPGPVDVAGHRIVHGGRVFHESVVVTPEVRQVIARQAEVAPAHNWFQLEAIETVDRALGAGIRQVAVFDTAFHSTLAPAAYVYPG